MSRSVNISVRTAVAALAAGYLFLAPATGAAQTTVVLDDAAHVDDARIQGGRFARTAFPRERLATKNHPSDASYNRRALLKFDTHNTVPARARVQSATLTLTVSKASAGTRTLGVYRVARAFDEQYASWYTRKRGYRWTTSGGDLAEKRGQVSVNGTVNAKITVDITALVQDAVNGKFGSSRDTRLGLVDLGRASDSSYREFFNSETANPSVRPVLKIVYGGSTPKPTTPTPTTPKPTEPRPTEPEPSNEGPSSGGSTLKVLHWNIHRGWGTDGRYDLDRIATWIAKINPNVVSLNEVERFSSYANEDQAKNLQAKLKSKTGANWYVYYRTGNGATNGHGNAILSRFPIVSTSHCQLSDRRTLANAAIMVNGRLVNFYATHLDSADGNRMRIAEIRRAVPCLSNDAEQRIIAGDFNARDYTTEIGMFRSAGYYDGWAEAASDGTAVDYPGNTAFGATRSRRIDYVWYSKNAKNLVLKSARMIDTRDSRGRMPSDHKPLLVTFSVR